MHYCDDDLRRFEAEGAAALPPAAEQGFVEHDGARIWFSIYGAGTPVLLLHGGLGHSGNWGYQLAPLLEAGHRVVLVDSRGHGRSTRDKRPYSYELMASDVLAVMDRLQLHNAALVGWSDGACISLVLARQAPARIAGVFFFACNMDPSGTKAFEATPVIDRCFARHRKDYAELSATPDDFDDFVADVGEMMRTQPDYSAADLSAIRRACRDRACREGRVHKNGARRVSRPEHSLGRTDSASRRQPLCSAAETGSVQWCHACVPGANTSRG